VEPKEPKQERLCELLNYLSDRLHLGDRTAEAALLDYLNRFSEVTSASSLRRWFRGQQFPWPSRRPLLAQAIGVEPTELEKFLLQGIPDTQEFLDSLPPIDPEFRASNEWEATINLDSQMAVSSAMRELSQHLSLENLVDLIDEFRAQARNRVEQLQAQTVGQSARATILGQQSVQDWPTISECSPHDPSRTGGASPSRQR
jgi:transcriptional regulator with XRE-family HTH domain